MTYTFSKLFAIACFAVWFGGFTFYASVVVPVGTEILGSARAQGAITQQVTDWLNVFSAIALLAMGTDWWLERKRFRIVDVASLKRPPHWGGLGVTIGLMLVALIALLILHRQLDGLIEPTESDGIRLSDRKQFYAVHRIYLWTSTVQWLLGWLWLVLFIRQLVPSSRAER